MNTLLLTAALCASTFPAFASAAPVSEKAVQMRNLGLAHLENEQPIKAEEVCRGLIVEAPGEPLGYANLAIALLRQQKYDAALAEVDRALALAPGRGDLLALRGDVLQWSGRAVEALAAYEQAAAASPEDPEAWYGLYRHASTLDGEAAQAALPRALAVLAKLRPENVVVQLALGQQAIRDGDRARATGVFLRLQELLWQEPRAAGAMVPLRAALESGDLAAARIPALRLENVLKIAPMYRESLRELATGIQGVPVTRFASEPPPSSFGDPIALTFEGSRLDATPTLGGLATGDFDGDARPDLVRLVAGQVEVRRSAAGTAAPVLLPAPPGLTGLLVCDLDNDGHLDLVAWGPEVLALWRGNGAGGFSGTPGLGPEGGAETAAVLDFDIEGDLDLVLAGGRARSGRRPAQLRVNALAGTLAVAPAETLPEAVPAGAWRAGQLIASDLDRDGDLDLVLAHAMGLTWLDNLRQGRFADRTVASGLVAAPPAVALASADLDGDGLPELITAGEGLAVWHNLGGRFAPLAVPGLPSGGRFDAVLAFDADNDGRLDLAAAGPAGVVVLGQQPGLRFAPLAVTGAVPASVLAAADLDGDGDLDLVGGGAAGLHRLDNQGGHRNGFLAVRLRGLDKGNSKNNLFGVGSVVEVRIGSAYQFREASGDVVHFGLGQARRAYLLRVEWTNGVPQQRLGVWGEQRVVEEQLLKGSCPFLYAWDGERFAFVTDLLWGAPIGLPVAPGVWAAADPSELVRVDGARPAGGRYQLRVTEELWEAAFFDHLRLWLVDHPAEVEVASNLRIVPPAGQLPERVLASRTLRPLAQALDGQGRDVTARVAARDEVYADGFEPSPYQGIARRPWTFTLDLGRAPGGPVRLLFDGWIFPADASLNLAVAQRSDLAWQPPRLEVETAAGWQELMPAMGPGAFGFPAGKTKTMVVDTPPLPPGARRLRLVTTLWLSWDRIAWTTDPADALPQLRAQLLPAVAEARYRGFSRLYRSSPNGPHRFDYHDARSDSPWLPFPGRYSRYGDVRELLAEADDRSVILAAGDEIVLEFDAAKVPPPPPGWQRTVFLESHGWDKDADRNTHQPQQLEPLPFRAMSGYPYGPGESFPSTPLLDAWRRDWLTREVAP